MKKQNIYPYAGLTWMMCGLYQLKNSNMFMFTVSAVMSAAFFFVSVMKKIRHSRSEGQGKEKV